MKVNKDNEEVISAEVHWYATNTDPFDVEKQVCKKRKRKGQNINSCRIDILKLDEVDIFVYDFQLTKKDTLRSRTTKIIKRFLPGKIIARWEPTKPSSRSGRNMTSEMLSMHVDSKGELVDYREEYGSSTSLYGHSSEDNVNFDGVSKSMSQFEYLYMIYFICFLLL